LIDEARSITGEAIVSGVADVDITGDVVEIDAEGIVQSVGGDGSSLVGRAIFERALANDSGKSGSVGRETLDSVDNDDTAVIGVDDEELVSIRINADRDGKGQSLAGGSRRASRG